MSEQKDPMRIPIKYRFKPSFASCKALTYAIQYLRFQN